MRINVLIIYLQVASPRWLSEKKRKRVKERSATSWPLATSQQSAETLRSLSWSAHVAHRTSPWSAMRSNHRNSPGRGKSRKAYLPRAHWERSLGAHHPAPHYTQEASPTPAASKYRSKRLISCRWAQLLGCECHRNPEPQLRLQKAREPAKMAASEGRWLLQKEMIQGLWGGHKCFHPI